MSIIFLLLFLLSFTSSVLSTRDDEIVLLKIKKQLRDPDILQSWIQGFNFCEFSTSYISIFCTSTGRVSSFIMDDLNITVPFPDAVCDLTELENLLICGMTKLYGSIPSCITKLPNLLEFSITYTSLSGSVPSFYNHPNITAINLAHNHLSGTIPPLSTLPNLQTLGLSSNYLSGTIPPSLSTSPNLRFLDLSSNYLSGTIPPSLSTLPINNLDLSSNYLTGTIPPELVHGLSLFLILSNNNLTGELPKCYGQIDFITINLGFNRLNGDASFLLGKQKSTFVIILANNDFEFDLSRVELSDNLFRFDISNNKIYGKVPESFATAAKLYDANLSFNRLCGELPQDGNMCRFSAAVFANNTCLFGNPWSLCPI